jgi:hypothetical protein
MEPSLKKDLKDRILEKCESFGLNEMLMNTYLRQFDEKTQISSIDMSYSISSLLEHPTRLESAFDKSADSENQPPNSMKNQNDFNSKQAD